MTCSLNPNYEMFETSVCWDSTTFALHLTGQSISKEHIDATDTAAV